MPVSFFDCVSAVLIWFSVAAVSMLVLFVGTYIVAAIAVIVGSSIDTLVSTKEEKKP